MPTCRRSCHLRLSPRGGRGGRPSLLRLVRHVDHGDLGHVAPDRYDYGEFDRYFAAILDVDPQAYFLPHVGVTGPLWWQQAHPEEMCQFEDGSTARPRSPRSSGGATSAKTCGG